MSNSLGQVKFVVIVGPTAAGKTGVSLELAEDGFEIISADSVQVYRHLDIGSGKPDRAARESVRHHLIDCVDPDYHFTAGEFCRRAGSAAMEIAARGGQPMVVGGTGLYIDSFFGGLSNIPEVDQDIRDQLYRELDECGLPCLYDGLLRIDPEFGMRIHPHDRQRILRGLEVYRGTGRPVSAYYGERRRYGSDAVLYIGLYEDRDTLRARIGNRVDSMVESGLVEEVQSLRSRGYGPELNSMKSIGYAEINGFLDGNLKRGEAIEKIKLATGQYAKRQLTWFKKNKRVHWFRAGERKEIKELLRRRIG